jgi:hypothetical protein
MWVEVHEKLLKMQSTPEVSATRVEQRRKRRHNRKNKKSQQTMWFIPLPDSMNADGKIWSNGYYGADKKRQGKHSERKLLEASWICQLESVLKMEHDVDDF